MNTSTTDKRIGVIGLGKVGLLIAHNLLWTGYPYVRVLLRDKEELDRKYNGISVQHPSNQLGKNFIDDFERFAYESDYIFICFNNGNAHKSFGAPIKYAPDRFKPGKSWEEVLKDENLVNKHGRNFLEKAYSFYSELINMKVDHRVEKYLPFNIEPAVEYGNLLRESRFSGDVFVLTNPIEEITYAIANAREDFINTYSLGGAMDTLRLNNTYTLIPILEELIEQLKTNFKKNPSDKVSSLLNQLFEEIKKGITCDIYGYHGYELVIDFKELYIGDFKYTRIEEILDDETKISLREKIKKQVVEWVKEHDPYPDYHWGFTCVVELFKLLNSNSDKERMNIGLFTPGDIGGYKNKGVYINRPAKRKNPDRDEDPGNIIPIKERKLDDLDDSAKKEIIELVKHENKILDLCESRGYFGEEGRRDFDKLIKKNQTKFSRTIVVRDPDLEARVNHLEQMIKKEVPIKYIEPWEQIEGFRYDVLIKNPKREIQAIDLEQYKKIKPLFSLPCKDENSHPVAFFDGENIVSVELDFYSTELAIYIQNLEEAVKNPTRATVNEIRLNKSLGLSYDTMMNIERLTGTDSKLFFICNYIYSKITTKACGYFDIKNRKGELFPISEFNPMSGYFLAGDDIFIIGDSQKIKQLKLSTGQITEIDMAKEYDSVIGKLTIFQGNHLVLNEDMFQDPNINLKTATIAGNSLFMFSENNLVIYNLYPERYLLKTFSLTNKFDTISLFNDYVCLLNKDRTYIMIFDWKKFEYKGEGMISNGTEVVIGGRTT